MVASMGLVLLDVWKEPNSRVPLKLLTDASDQETLGYAKYLCHPVHKYKAVHGTTGFHNAESDKNAEEKKN